jgi:23S rRNA (cytidine1920-2'-O)/16S rRNA (cytidine1409-2'-O)-methyltransferase
MSQLGRRRDVSWPRAVSRRLRPLVDIVRELAPDDDPVRLIASGAVEVGGLPARSPGARVDATQPVRLRQPEPLRGEAKLRAALESFDLSVLGRVALDVGAAAGGFTRVLLEAGARRVYAVDAGHGQLLGSLRQDSRVVNLEATNVADLNRSLVPERVDVVTVDVSYLSLRAAVAQLDRISLAGDAELVGLVKPMFELRRASAPVDETSLAAALEVATAGVTAAGWQVVASIPSPVAGAHGARELLIHARRSSPEGRTLSPRRRPRSAQ